jgi:hypothetical protein
MDFCTGGLLIAAPRLTFRLMGLAAASDTTFIRFVGAFVLSVGCCYFWGLYRFTLRSTWEFTALVRGCVGGFVVFAVVLQLLESRWMSVAVTDVGLAVLQIFFLKKGWVRDE